MVFFIALCFLNIYGTNIGIIFYFAIKLSVGNLIVSSIPNIRYFRILLKILYTKDWQYEDHGILDKTHVRFFTRKSIEKMYQEAG